MRSTHQVTMTEPMWQRHSGSLHLLVPEPPHVRRRAFGHIQRHRRKRIYYAYHPNGMQSFYDLEEAKTWLLALWRLS